MPNFLSWQFDDIATTGPDPFPASSAQNNAAVGASTFTIAAGSTSIVVDLTDNDADFNDRDPGQKLVSDVTFNGVTYTAGQRAAPDYSYIVRPVGSTDPADEVQIFILKLAGNAGDQVGILADGWLTPGVEYEIFALPATPDTPSASYSSLFICFAKGTQIDTPNGPRPIETLQPGDRVTTRDHGAQPVLWISRQVARFSDRDDPRRPVLIRKHALGPATPRRDLVVSPHHRIWARLPGPRGPDEVLIPAKACLGLPGVRTMRGLAGITYYNLLLPKHAILDANGAGAESFYPGAQGLRALDATARAALDRCLPFLCLGAAQGYGAPARPFLTRREAEDRLAALNAGPALLCA